MFSGLMLPPQLCLHTLSPPLNGLCWLCAAFPGSQFSVIPEIQVGTPEEREERRSLLVLLLCPLGPWEQKPNTLHLSVG